MAKAQIHEDSLVDTQPEMLKLFIKTNKAIHVGGHVFFSEEEFDDKKDAVQQDVAHIIRTVQDSDSNVEFKSWGVMDSIGKVVKEFDSYKEQVE